MHQLKTRYNSQEKNLMIFLKFCKKNLFKNKSKKKQIGELLAFFDNELINTYKLQYIKENYKLSF